MSDRFRELAAGYVLGALAPEEREEFEAHLEDCARCRAEVLEFSPLPALMGRLDVDHLDGPPFDAGAALAAVTARHEYELRSTARRWRLAAMVAAAAAVLLAVVVVVQRGDDTAEPAFDPGVPIELVIESPFVTEGTMTVNERDWGTRVEIDLIGLPERTGYRLWAVGVDGRWEIAGSWGPTPTGTCRVVGATSLTRGELDRVVVTSLDQTDELASAR